MKVKFTIPEGMHDISLEKYRKVNAIISNETSDTAKFTKVISLLCDVHQNHVLRLTTNQFEELRQDLNWLFEPNMKHELVPTFTLDKVEYGFIPNLSDLSVGEFADLDTLTSKGNANDNLEEIMAILYRPITNKWREFYTIERYDPQPHHKEIMKAMPMNVALGALVFFWSIAEELAKGSAPYLEVQELQTLSLKNGGGM